LLGARHVHSYEITERRDHVPGETNDGCRVDPGGQPPGSTRHLFFTRQSNNAMNAKGGTYSFKGGTYSFNSAKQTSGWTS